MSDEIALVKKSVVDTVTKKVKDFKTNQELHIPINYSAENAMKAAWLQLQEVKDATGKLALVSCTKDSIANCLFSMIVQGLDPNKKQCYFIPYGNKLQLQRSYFGTMAVVKRVDENIEDIFAELVYEGDEFEYKILRGKTEILLHKQNLNNVNRENIKAGYCTLVYKDNKEVTTIMTMEQIKQSWKQSKMNPIDDKGAIKKTSTHWKFIEEMCKKTVINKACKTVINSSSDKNLFIEMVKQTETNIAKAEVMEEIEENANAEIIDIPVEECTEESTNIEEVPEVINEQPTTVEEALPY